MRGGKSEIGENAIAHVSRDVPVETMNCVLTTSLKCAQNLAQILWVQTRGKRARPYHIEKQHRNVSSLGLNAVRLRKRLLHTRQLRHEPLPSRKLYRLVLYSIIRQCISSCLGSPCVPWGIRIGLSYVPIAAKIHCRPPVTSAVMRSHERLNTSACRKNRGAVRRVSFVRSSNSRRAASLTLNNSSRAVDLRASSPRCTTSSTMELSRLGWPLWGQ